MSVISSSFKILALPSLLALGFSACGDSSSSDKSPKKAPTSSEAPKATPTPKVQPPVVQPTAKEYETVFLDKEERIKCELINNGASRCVIANPELIPVQDERKIFRLAVSFGCKTRPLHLVLSAGDGELVLPLKQDPSGSSLTREMAIEGPGPLQLRTLDSNALYRSSIVIETCPISINVIAIEKP
jgi:hypothetical protein